LTKKENVDEKAIENKTVRSSQTILAEKVCKVAENSRILRNISATTEDLIIQNHYWINFSIKQFQKIALIIESYIF